MTPQRTLRIADSLALPLDAVTSTQVVYGGKGMGKTNFGSVLVEEMTKAGLRWSVLDPLGVWWGLRHSADGKGPGIWCLIIGGTHGDLPLEPTAGAVVADLVAEEEGVNCVIDFSRKATGEMWSVGERVKFVTAYAHRLFQRQGELIRGERRPPLMQVLDESARYIPQIVPANQSQLALCVGAWEQFTEEGRNVGLGVTFLTQRSARMNKSVSELADVMVAFRIVGPRSVEAVTDWLGAHVERKRTNEIVEQLRSLPVGHALVVSPGWLGVEKVVQVRMRETFDSSATPKPGERRREPARGAKPDLEKYRVRMAETIEKAKAEDPRELRKELAHVRSELTRAQRQLQTPRGPTTPAPRVEEKRVPVLKDGQLARFERGTERLAAFGNDLPGKIAEAVAKAVLPVVVVGREITAALATIASANGHRPPAPRAAVRPLPAPRHPLALTPTKPLRGERQSARAPETTVRPRAGARRMLEAIARRYPVPTTEAQCAQLAKVKRSGGTFGTYKSDLIRGGYMVESRDGLELTGEGWNEIGMAPGEAAPQTTEGVLQLYAGTIRAGARRMVEALMETYPDALRRDDLAAQADVALEGGTFGTYLSDLRKAGLVEDQGDEVRASELLMNPAGAAR